MANLANGEDIDLKEYVGVVIKRWKLVLILMVIFAVGAFVYSRLQKPVYVAKAVVMVRGSLNSTSASQYSGLAAMMGINLASSGSNVEDMMRIIRSKAVAAKVVDDLKLSNRIKGWDNPAMKKSDMASSVSGMLKDNEPKGNIIEVNVEANDPQLTADVANAFVDALSYFMNELNNTEAQRKLKYIESELPRVEAELKRNEAILALGGSKSFGQSGPQRDFDILNSVYTMLRKEKESAKLDAAKDLPMFSVIDPAEKPLSKSKPKTKSNVQIGLVMGLFTGIFSAFFLEYIEKSNKKS